MAEKPLKVRHFDLREKSPRAT